MYQHEILAAVGDRFINSVGLLPVKHPRDYKFSADEYITYFVAPNTPVGKLTGGDELYGLITVLINYKGTKGEYWGQVEAQKVADLFPKFLKFGGIEIVKRPHIQRYVDNRDTWWYTPVSISYKVKDC